MLSVVMASGCPIKTGIGKGISFVVGGVLVDNEE